MNLTEGFDVSPAKVAELLARLATLRIDPAAIDEQFVRGGGPGGQKINKTSNCVLLRYPPLDLVVRCQRDRRRNVNRFLALRELVDRAEMAISPGSSKRLNDVERKRRNKARAGRRARARHAELKEPPDRPS
ncbi:MAG TPA: peptide chain release factor-like protein [Planctomycetota bacterium]|jgi:protein subunit release factor B|nr:peptide chain release factor-like protein [Planctomycetota bacterium]